MNIAPEESEAYQWALKERGYWKWIADIAVALRRHVGAEMRLEWEAEHLQPDMNGDIGCDCDGKNCDPRHDYTDADWDKAAHDALMGGGE